MIDLTTIIAGGFNASAAAEEAPKGGGGVPDCIYYFKICDEKVQTSKDNEYVNDGQVRLCITCEIQADINKDTSFSGRKVFSDFWLAHEDVEKLAASQWYLGKLIEAIMGKGVILADSSELLQKPAFVAELKTKKVGNGKEYQNMINVISVEEAQKNPPKATPVASQPAQAAAPAKQKQPWE